jgi:hypothetical protein
MVFNFLKLVIVLEFFLIGCKTSDSAHVMGSGNATGSAENSDLKAIAVGDKGVVTVECVPYAGSESSSYKLNGIKTSILDGESTFTLNYEPRTVIPGVGKNCVASLPFAVPAGWQMSLMRVDVAVDNKLSADSFAVVHGVYAFDTSMGIYKVGGDIDSGASGYSLAYNDAKNNADVLWSPCNNNKPFMPTFSLGFLIPKSGKGKLTMKAATFQFAWRKCQGS